MTFASSSPLSPATETDYHDHQFRLFKGPQFLPVDGDRNIADGEGLSLPTPIEPG
jgi:hypothetical protein